jgi:hypothetical protein
VPHGSAQWIAGAILIVAVAVALMVPSLALAGSGHDPAPDRLSAQTTSAEIPAQQPQTTDGSGGAIDNRIVGGLPLTGLDLMIMAAAAMSVSGIAIALRLLSRPRRPVQGLSPGVAPTPNRVLAVAEVQRSGSTTARRLTHSGS